MPSVDRQTALLQWALQALGEELNVAPVLTSVAGDASSRRYFRLPLAGRSFIAVDAPPATEKNAAFVAVRELLGGSGVRVPQIIDVDSERGFLLLEDFGDRLLLPALDPGTADHHYRAAFSVLLKMSAIDLSLTTVPAYDEAVLAEELSRFGQWFVEGLLGHVMLKEEAALLEELWQVLIDSALAQPRVFVHRDFHSRNLMLLENGELGVIDFQDALNGPLTYDLVSLLRDCYVEWPSDSVIQWASAYRGMLEDAGCLNLPSEGEFLRQFDLMGLQRHIKVLGTFARLHLRDGKDAYLDDLPLVMRYVHSTLARYASDEAVFAQALHWFEHTVQPLAAQQGWSDA